MSKYLKVKEERDCLMGILKEALRHREFYKRFTYNIGGLPEWVKSAKNAIIRI